MAVTNGYITVNDLKNAIEDDSLSDSNDVVYELAIETASRQIDNWCDPLGTRHFWAVDAPEPRVFFPTNSYLVMPGFFSTTVGLVVRTDGTGNGVFESTWDEADYQAQPGVRPNGEPFTKLVATGVRKFPVNGRRQCIEVTAQWGWDEVPRHVQQATQILATAYYRSKDFTGEAVGFDDREKDNGWDVYNLAKSLVKPYMLDKPCCEQDHEQRSG